MGDPHGVGPEVLLKTLQRLLQKKTFTPIVFGAEEYLHKLYTALGLDFDWRKVEVVSVTACPFPPQWGEVGESSGQIALVSLRSARLHCRDQNCPLLVTAPVSKEALHLAGFSNPGQTEYVGSFFEASDPTMIFLSERLKVVLVTVHIALKNVFRELTVERIVAKATLFHSALKRLGIARPNLAVCGLNPHSSEGGLFGDEESRLIIPAMKQLEDFYGSGVFHGPFPPDTVFANALDGGFDGVIAHYHDQGLIPFKLIAFDSGVNTTLGLPIVRTSPDHGTAFDIAGKGVADASSMIAAVEWGLRLCQPGSAR